MGFPSHLLITSPGQGQAGFDIQQRSLITSPIHPVASVDKETFLLMHGDRIGKSLLLLAYTYTSVRCSKLFKELVVLLNELQTFPKGLNSNQWKHGSKEH